MTDPYLISTNDDTPAPTVSAERIDELARRMCMSRAMIESMPPEELDRMERFVAHREACAQTWGDLAESITKKLMAAGFRQHDLYGQRGGFALSMWDDGVILSWLTTDCTGGVVTPFENTVERAILPALEQILQATGFTARIIPDEEDNGGDIRVTGWQGSGSTKADSL